MDKERQKPQSSGQRKIKIDDVYNLIDNITSLNEIFKVSLDSYISFDDSDKDALKQLINYLFVKFDMTSTKLVLSKEYHIVLSYCNFSNNDVIKFFAFLIYYLNLAYFYQTNNKILQYFEFLFKLLVKLFDDKQISAKDICFFLKYFMILSIFNVNETFRTGRSIKKLMIFYVGLSNLITFFKDYEIPDKEELLNDMLKFIDNSFLTNNLNLIILSKVSI